MKTIWALLDATNNYLFISSLQSYFDPLMQQIDGSFLT
jgi:hypothetical protein